MSAPFYTQRIATRRGSHVEPPLNEAWSNLEKLEWQLSSTLRDAGLPSNALTVEAGSLRINGVSVESFDVRGPGWSASVGDFHSAWSTINGIAYGLRTTPRECDLTDGRG